MGTAKGTGTEGGEREREGDSHIAMKIWRGEGFVPSQTIHKVTYTSDSQVARVLLERERKVITPRLMRTEAVLVARYRLRRLRRRLAGASAGFGASLAHCDFLWPGNWQLWQTTGGRPGTGWLSPAGGSSRRSGRCSRLEWECEGESRFSPIVRSSLGVTGVLFSKAGLSSCSASRVSGRVNSTWTFSAPRGPSQSGTLLTVLTKELGPVAWCTASRTPANGSGFSGVGIRRSSTWIFSAPRGPSQSGTVRIVRATGSMTTVGDGGAAGNNSGRVSWPGRGFTARAARQASTYRRASCDM